MPRGPRVPMKFAKVGKYGSLRGIHYGGVFGGYDRWSPPPFRGQRLYSGRVINLEDFRLKSYAAPSKRGTKKWWKR